MSRPARNASMPPRTSRGDPLPGLGVGAQHRVGAKPSGADAGSGVAVVEHGVPVSGSLTLEADADPGAPRRRRPRGRSARRGCAARVGAGSRHGEMGYPLSGDANAGRDARRRCTACGGSACALTASWRGIGHREAPGGQAAEFDGTPQRAAADRHHAPGADVHPRGPQPPGAEPQADLQATAGRAALQRAGQPGRSASGAGRARAGRRLPCHTCGWRS